MQDVFGNQTNLYDVLRGTVTDARLTRYMNTCSNDQAKAIDLYYWNAKLGESFHVALQTWEIALRNRLNVFLLAKIGNNWPFEDRSLRKLHERERNKVRAAVTRQKYARKGQTVPVGAVVADLSAGFWVSLLSKRYDLPFVWRKNLDSVFPNDNLERFEVSEICNKLLDLRNRVAHHEPVFHLPLEARREEIDRLLAAMCPASHALTNASCPFATTWAARPHQ